jgi:hypothetical protein
MTYNRNRSQALETAKTTYTNLVLDFDHYVIQGEREVTFMHYSGSKAQASNRRALREALEAANFEVTRDGDLSLSVKVRKDKIGKKVAAEAEAKKKAQARQREWLDREAAAEMAFEMRAAFGPGQTVVNVLTGQRYRT